jgi:CPA2 family monovalent cation:H+ antiporter-2
LYQRFEAIFVSNLSEKERSEVEERSALSHLVPWEATLTEFTLSEYSPLVLHTLLDSNIKKDHGVTVAVIKRGNRTIVAPTSDEVLLPRDRLYLIGTYEQLATVQEVIEHERCEESEFDDDHFGMIPLHLQAGHPFVGKQILDCGVRESANGLIVGIERDDRRFLNPEPSMMLESGDVIWLVGDRTKLKELGK